MKPASQPIASPVAPLRPGQSAYHSCAARLVLAICLTVTCMVLSKAANLVRVPKTNAIELLCQMKNAARLKAIPVVMLTSYNQHMDRRACCQLGVNLNLVKKVSFAQFTETIRPVTVFRALINEPPAA